MTGSKFSKIPWNQWIYHEFVGRLVQGKKWLELGCGRGPFDPAVSLARQRYREAEYVGIDLDKRSLLLNPSDALVCGDIGELPFPDGYFDVVSSNMVFEHLADPLRVMREMYRVLSRDGVALIHAASSRHFSLVAGRLISFCVGKRHYRSLVCRYSGRQEGDVFPALYRASSLRETIRLAEESGMWASFGTYLETPPVLPRRFDTLEYAFRRLLPPSCKGSLMLMCMKDRPSTVISDNGTAALAS
jgi:ubiquinone/menaquinone biosynthesis C-methylase UbiE